jgi:shikimate dehydrogenase
MTISGTTKLAAVLGWPIEHTRSPAMLNAAFIADRVDAVLVPIGVTPEELPAAVAGLRAMKAIGASVTLPHKLAVARLCDELSPAAKAIGAVNCLELARDDGRLIGHNTDCDGFLDALTAAGCELRGKRVVLLGAGGAARAVAYGVRGARAIEVIARKPGEVAWAPAWPWTADNLRDCFARADILVDCTSACLQPESDSELTDSLPFDALPAGAWVATLVYHRATSLLERASSLGHSTLDGRAMLVHQGARAYAIWTGLAAPVEVMTRALDASLSR